MKDLKSFLVYIDGEAEPAVIDSAIATAQRMGVSVTLASVIPSVSAQMKAHVDGFDVEHIQSLLVQDQQQELDELASGRGSHVKTRVFVGDPTTPIIQAMRDDGYDVLIKAPSPSHGLREHIFGGTDMRLMRACPGTVYISRPHAMPSGKIVAAVEYDVDDEAKAKMNQSILDVVAFASTYDPAVKETQVVTAWNVYGEDLMRSRTSTEEIDKIRAARKARKQAWIERLLSSYREGLNDDMGSKFNPVIKLLNGDATLVIPAYVEEINADVIVLGTGSRLGVSGMLFGNTAETILSHVDCSVIVQKPVGFQTPALH